MVSCYNRTMDSINSTDESMDLVLQLSESSEESTLYRTAAIPCATANESEDSILYKTAALPCTTAYESAMDISDGEYNELSSDIPVLNGMDQTGPIEELLPFKIQPVASSTLNSNDLNAAFNNVPRIALKSLRINHSDSSDNSSNGISVNASDAIESLNEQPTELESRLGMIPEQYTESHMDHEAPTPTPVIQPTPTNYEYKHLTPEGDIIYFEWGEKQSQHNKNILISSNGYVYTVKIDKRRDMDLYPVYRCSKRNCCKSVFLPAIPGGRKKSILKPHQCQVQPLAKSSRAYRQQLKQNALEHPELSASAITEELQTTHYGNGDYYHQKSSNIPSSNASKMIVHRMRIKSIGFQPKDIHFDIKEDRFPLSYLRRDIHTVDARHLIFASDIMLERLAQARTWYVDATFKIIGPPFYQLASIHVFVCDKKSGIYKQIAAAYMVMSRRRKVDYVMVFQAVFELVKTKAHVQCFVMDYETAIWAAIAELNAQKFFSPVPVTRRGCHFHHAQALYRKIKKIGLEVQYIHNGPSAYLLRMFMALALVPPAKVIECLEHIKKRIAKIDTTEEAGILLQSKFSQFVVYMETQWINGKVFTMEHWSAYMQFVRTNNHIEGDHSRLNKRCHHKKQSIDPLVQILHKESLYIDSTVVKLHAGHLQAPVLSSKTAKRNGQLTAIWDAYHSDPEFTVIMMLESIASDLLIPSEWIMSYLADPEAPSDPLEVVHSGEIHNEANAGPQVEANIEYSADVNREHMEEDTEAADILKWIQHIRLNELESLTNENLPFLSSIVFEEEFNERHTEYLTGEPGGNQMMFFDVVNPFAYHFEKVETVHKILRTHFLSYLESIGVDAKEYLWKVLLPIFITKILMDHKNISQGSAEHLLLEVNKILDRREHQV